MSGNVAIVGAPYDDNKGYASGAAYVFERDDLTGQWNQVDKLSASDGNKFDYFGYGVSVSGNIAIVGANGDDDMNSGSGSAYVFERDDLTGRWNQTFKLLASDGAGGDRFGTSVSVSGNVAIIGAYGDDDMGSVSGSAYVFEKNTNTGHWAEVDKLTASDGAAFDKFGDSVSVSGNVAIVGAYDGDGNVKNSGSAYVFEKNTNTGHWAEVDKLTASDGMSGDVFGRSVSVSGNVAIVGAHDSNDNGKNSGSAYVFERNNRTGRWSQKAHLLATGGAEGDKFGTSVSVSGNVAIVGAYGGYVDEYGINSGSAYVFERDGLTGFWSQKTHLGASGGDADDYFGYSVSVSGNVAIVGAPFGRFHSGYSYVYESALNSP